MNRGASGPRSSPPRRSPGRRSSVAVSSRSSSHHERYCNIRKSNGSAPQTPLDFQVNLLITHLCCRFRADNCPPALFTHPPSDPVHGPSPIHRPPWKRKRNGLEAYNHKVHSGQVSARSTPAVCVSVALSVRTRKHEPHRCRHNTPRYVRWTD